MTSTWLSQIKDGFQRAFRKALEQKDEQTRNLSESVSTAQNSWTVGIVNFSRVDMEKALQDGKRLRVNVTGLCRIADDVSADLADRAIERFHLVGKLLASPAVYEVLTRKGKIS